MPLFKDLTGIHFGRLTVLSLSHKEKMSGRYRYFWLCRCDCGNTHIARTDSLTSGNVKSCGCLHKEQAVANVSKHHSHKLSGKFVYHEWQAIKARCYNPNNHSYPRYGARGIRMFSGWLNNAKAFNDYVSALPHYMEDGYTLDRINNSLGYLPGNLRWATAREQSLNRRSNVLVEYRKKMIPLIEASKKSGIPYGCLSRRHDKGDTGDRLFRPVAQKGEKRFVIYNGKKMGLNELSKVTGINLNTLKTRWFYGKRDAELTSMPTPR